MGFCISSRAEEERDRRGIPRELLDSVLKEPQQIVEGQEGEKVYQSQFKFENDKIYLIRAIVTDQTKPANVVTVYRTSQISKYWRDA
jgi:Domain of unknown function (DUF4258)